MDARILPPRGLEVKQDASVVMYQVGQKAETSTHLLVSSSSP